MHRLALLLYLILSLPHFARAQQEAIYKGFDVIQTGESLTLRWTIIAGNSCIGIGIDRSSDGEKFERIGSIAGICGDPYVDEPFEFTDTMPLLNRTSYYRLEFGGVGKSHVLETDVIVHGAGGYVFVVRPGDGNVRLYFENPGFSPAEVRVFDLSGRLLYTASTRDRFFDIPAQLRGRTGLWLFQISRNGQPYASGKFY